MNFEWDPRKEALNRSKHSVSFEEAAIVLTDTTNMTLFDKEHSSDEERWITMGRSGSRILVVVHTYPNAPSDDPVRIISARMRAGRNYIIMKTGGNFMSDMLDEYDFSKAERGKFYIPPEEIRLPHYLSPSLEQKLALLSQKSGKSRDALIGMVLENELDLLLTVTN